MNRELLIKVRDQIAAHPEHFDMGSFWDFNEGTPLPEFEPNQFLAELSVVRGHVCGTSACIGGWAIAFSPDEKLRELGLGDGQYIALVASRLLELTDEEIYIFDHLAWPEPFRAQFLLADGKREDSLVAVAFINYLLEQEALNAN